MLRVNLRITASQRELLRRLAKSQGGLLGRDLDRTERNALEQLDGRGMVWRDAFSRLFISEIGCDAIGLKTPQDRL